MARTEYDPLTPSPRMFWEFCAVRQEEWWNRYEDKGPPYTSDPILQIKGIPNVYRELDRENIFIVQSISTRPVGEAAFGSISFRLTNRIPPHKLFGGVPRSDQVDAWCEHLLKLQAERVPIFTRIFMTPPLFRYNRALRGIADNIGEIDAALRQACCMKEAFEVFHNLPQVRNFFAWQCTSDILEAGKLDFDEDTWCYLGPGPLRAMNMIYGRRMSQTEAMYYARKMHEYQDRALANTYTPWRPPPPGHVRQGPRLSLKNIEHALCEYMRWVWAHWRRAT